MRTLTLCALAVPLVTSRGALAQSPARTIDPLIPEGYALAFEWGFEDGTLGALEPRPGSEWAVIEEGGEKILSLVKHGEAVEVRAPFGYVTLPEPLAGDLVLTFVGRNLTAEDVGHRDICSFLGWLDMTHMTYVHTSAATDEHANGVFLVDGADRAGVDMTVDVPKLKDKDEHLIKVTRDLATGEVRAYIDDMLEPCLVGVDPKPRVGRVGVGSFDDPVQFDDIRLYVPIADLLPEEGVAPSLRRIVPEGSEVRRLATGYAFTEGPAWDAANGRCLFTDIPANHINWVTLEGETGVFVDQSESANGLLHAPDGTLLACRHGGRDVVRYSTEGEVIETVADAYDGKRLNSPNDLCMDAAGNVYFTDPRFGPMDDLEQDAQAVYLRRTDGTVLRVVDDMPKPNGVEVTGDGTTLFVADSEKGHVRAYPILEDGTVGAGRELGQAIAPEDGVPDGMTLDADGNVYCTSSGGVWVFTPKGQCLGRIATPETPSNCTFGGPDGKTLFITARTSVYAIELAVGR